MLRVRSLIDKYQNEENLLTTICKWDYNQGQKQQQWHNAQNNNNNDKNDGNKDNMSVSQSNQACLSVHQIRNVHQSIELGKSVSPS